MIENKESIIDIQKIFLLLVLFEILVMAVVLFGDIITMAVFGICILGLGFLLFSPVEPLIGIPFMLIATGLNYYAAIKQSDVTFYKFSTFHIVTVLTIISAFFNRILSGKTSFPSLPLWAPLIAFNISIALSLIVTPLFFDGFMDLFRLVALSVLVVIIVMCTDKMWKVKFVTYSFVIVPIGVSLYTIYEIASGGEFYKANIIRIARELGLNVYRSTGTFANPNDLANFIMVGIVMCFGMLFLKNINMLTRLILISGIGLSSVGLIASFSRGGWVATFVGVFTIIILHRKWKYLFYFIGVFLGVLVIIAITHPEIVIAAVTRFQTLLNPMGEESSSSRLSLLKTGIWMWQDHPILGVGAGGFPYYAAQYMDPSMPRMLVDVIYPHTLQAKILAEEGIVGIIVFTWLFLTVFVNAFKQLKYIKNDFLKNAHLSFLALYIAYIASFTFSSELHNNVFWMTIGMLYVSPIVEKKLLKNNVI